MKRISSKTRPNGNRVVTVELEPDEDLVAFASDGFYKLGDQGDIVPGHLLHDTEQVCWCWHSQKWV